MRLLAILLSVLMIVSGCTKPQALDQPVTTPSDPPPLTEAGSPELLPGLTQVQVERLLGSLKAERQEEPGASAWQIEAEPWAGQVEGLGESQETEVLLATLRRLSEDAEVTPHYLLIWLHEGAFALQPLQPPTPDAVLAPVGGRLAAGEGGPELALVWQQGSTPWPQLFRLNGQLRAWVRLWQPFADEWPQGGQFAWLGGSLSHFAISGELPEGEGLYEYERQGAGYGKATTQMVPTSLHTLMGFLADLAAGRWGKASNWVAQPTLVDEARGLGLATPPRPGFSLTAGNEGSWLVGGDVRLLFTVDDERVVISGLELRDGPR